MSGQGIASWYAFLKSTGDGFAVDEVVDAEIAASAQPAGVIAAHGTAGAPGADRICVQAIDRFLDTLGAEAANLALRYLARGGVYIAGGGICAKLLERIQDGRVAQAYLDRGDASEIVAACPLYVSDAEDLGLAGVKAAARAWVASHAL